MFKNRKKQNRSASTVSCPESIIKKNNKCAEEDSKLSRNSKKSRKKNFIYVLQKKINSVFDSKSKHSIRFHSNSKASRSKSFEVLSNSFEEADTDGVEDQPNEKPNWGSKRSQSTRCKQAICPADYSLHIQANSSPTRTIFKSEDEESTLSIINSSERNEMPKSPNFSNSNLVSTPTGSNIIENNSTSLKNDSTSLQIANDEDTFPNKKTTTSDNASEVTDPVAINIQKQITLLSNGSKCKDIKTMNLKDLGINSAPYFEFEKQGDRSLVKEIRELWKYGWYWGPLNRNEAEEKLSDQPNGSFLVRDSSDVKYLLSLSFRSFGKTLHTRIEHSNGLFSFYPQPDHDSHRSLVGLINHCISESDMGVLCYSRPLLKGSPSFPVRLTQPVSRFMHVRSLQYLCRFVIRQYTNINHIRTLPLPTTIKGYLEESYY